MMLRQNEMFRARASGTFRDLLVGILKDPAMLVYLDNGENVKTHPNENFGRELLELFTMGVGNYTERDVREAARAFTGWTNDVLVFKFDTGQHDFGQKTFLGRTGPFDGEDIIDIILAQPVTAEFMAAKIYRFFVREEIDVRLKAELGRTFRDSGYQMKPLLKRIFLSKDFYSAPSFATQIKSPVHLVVSTYKKMSLRGSADDSRLRPDDEQPGAGAVRSAERRRLGRRPHLDHAVDAARRAAICFAACCFPTSRASVRPIASMSADRRARRAAVRPGHEHHGSHQGRRRSPARWPSRT